MIAILAIYGLVTTALLVIAIGGNQDLAAEIRNLRHHLRVAQGERDLDRQRQMAAHPAGGSTVVAFRGRPFRGAR